jgi:uncharacterized protein (DUF2225 family)
VTTIAPATIICPVCHQPFETLQLHSTNTFGPRTTDLYQFNGGLQALPYEIHSCPNCGFTGYDDEFDADHVDESIANLVNERIKPLVKAEPPTAGRSFEYAAWISIWKGQRAFDTAWLLLKAAWCCSLDELAEPGRAYRQQAITYFQQAMESNGIPADEKAVYCYLIGELCRRIGESERASMWFDRAIEAAPDDEKGRWWAGLAAQQKVNPKEFIE